MQKRLMASALSVVAKRGYSETTISAICDDAGVTRGAFGHYYDGLEQLLTDVAEEVVRRHIRRLGIVLLNEDSHETRLSTLVEMTWNKVFRSKDGMVMYELIAAARTDTALALRLNALWTRMNRMFEAAARHYFTTKPGVNLPVERIFHLHHWQLRGLLTDEAIDPERVKQGIDDWIEVFGSLVEAKTDISGPPTIPGWRGDA